MADVDSTPSSASFNLADYKDSVLFALTVFMPPVAIALRQGKMEIETRHLALSIALYLSVICYMPAVVHAYWLLYVRDNGGLKEWSGARVRQAKGLWNNHGGVAKAKVDLYAPKISGFLSEKRTAARELYGDAREAYTNGKTIEWTKEKLHVAAQKVNSLLEPFPRVQKGVHFIEHVVQRVFNLLAKIYHTIRSNPF